MELAKFTLPFVIFSFCSLHSTISNIRIHHIMSHFLPLHYFISFHLTSLSFPSPSSHIRFPNALKHVRPCFQMQPLRKDLRMHSDDFHKRSRTCWKSVALWGLKLWSALRLQGPRRCHLVQTWELHPRIWLLEWPLVDCVDSPEGQLPTAAALQEQGVMVSGAWWNSMGSDGDWLFEQ